MGKINSYRSIYIASLVLSVLAGGQSLATTASSGGSMNIDFGLSYNKGGSVPVYGSGYGYDGYGYGGYGGGYGGIGGAGALCGGYGPGMPAPIMMPPAPPMPAMPGYATPCQICAAQHGGGGFFGPGMNGPGMFGPGMMGPGMFGPGMNPGFFAQRPVPPPPPMIPPHIAMQNQGWGPGWASYPGPMMPGPGFGPNCLPCSLGMNGAGGIGPVPGGPAFANGGIYETGRGGWSGSGVVYVGSRNEWEKSDTADIVWGTAVGLGMQATNVYPVAVPRQQPTFIGPMWYGGDRDTNLIPRPHVAP